MAGQRQQDPISFYQIRDDLNEMYETLLKRSAEFEQFARAAVEKLPAVYQEIEEDVKLKTEDVIAAVQDQTPIPEHLNFHRFFMTFSWGTIMLSGYYLMYLQGSTVLPLLLDFIIDTSSAVLLAYIIIPAVLYFHITKHEEYGRKSRFTLLVAALFQALAPPPAHPLRGINWTLYLSQGLLVGFLLSNCSTIIHLPIETINMLFVAVVSRVIGHKLNNDRQAYFGIINGIGFIFIILIGFFTRELSKPYMFATVLAVFTSHVVIQVYMRRVMQSDLRPSYILLMMMTLSIFCQTLVRMLCSTHVQKSARNG